MYHLVFTDRSTGRWRGRFGPNGTAFNGRCQSRVVPVGPEQWYYWDHDREPRCLRVRPMRSCLVAISSTGSGYAMRSMQEPAVELPGYASHATDAGRRASRAVLYRCARRAEGDSL